MPMEFYDASTQSKAQSNWVRPVEPKSIPTPSVFLNVLSIVVITLALIGVAGSVVEIVLDGRPLAIFIHGVFILWFGVMALFQYVGVYQRSYLTSLIVLFQTAMMLVFWSLLGIILVLRYEQEIWTAIAICTMAIPPAVFCLMQYDWIRRLSDHYGNDDRPVPPQVTLRQMFVLMLIMAVVCGTAASYYRVRLYVPVNKPFLNTLDNYSLW